MQPFAREHQPGLPGALTKENHLKMKQVLTACFVLGLCVQAMAQKKPLDVHAAKNWPVLRNPLVSPDKQHLAYQITDSTVVVQHIRTKNADTFAVPNYKTHLSFSFDASGTQLVFASLNFRQKPERPRGDGVAVDLWSWKDPVLKSAELYQLSAPDSLIAKDYIDIATKSKTKTDTVAWSWTGWQYTRPTVTVSRKFNGRLAKKYPVSDSIHVIAQVAKNEFVLLHTTATGPANLVLTKKFKTYKPLTDINPQKDYKWYTAEIISLDSADQKAILYRPEDFDELKKYPVIISLTDSKLMGSGNTPAIYNGFGLSNTPWLHNGNITGRDGTGLYSPVLSNGILNSAYFAGRGYVIVEIPSIITKGCPGPAMAERVKSVVEQLAKYNWVDTARLGLHGQGTSGYFVNYIIARTPIFKAAQESGGQTDLISHYGSIDGKGESMQPYYDGPNGFFGKTLWEDSAAYIWQSPVILANRIQTPLLMMHNKEDMITPFAQAIELFTGMRRLGQRCWLLQYDNEQHTLINPENQEDFTLRLEQFFSHYLKGAGAPIWMTRGVAARDKGIISGLEIDTEISTPPVGGLLRKDTANNFKD